ncbi:MAG: hypothetical protein KC620_03210 [Myxococcales bacterium]|nr:hypothetical protein [Myxococcales bacterium]
MRTLILLITALAFGCGDPLASGDYPGEPLLSLSGPLLFPQGTQVLSDGVCATAVDACIDDALDRCPDDEFSCPGLDRCEARFDQCIEDYDSGQADDVRLRLSVIWWHIGDFEVTVEQQSVITGQLPARYRLTLYGPPPAKALQVADGGHFAIGVVMAYHDYDNDGRYDPYPEAILGGIGDFVILYTPDGINDALYGRWSPGYHRARWSPDNCETGVPVLDPVSADATSPLRFEAPDELLKALVSDFDCDAGGEWAACDDADFMERCEVDPEHIVCRLCAGVDDVEYEEAPLRRSVSSAETSPPSR